MTVPVFLACWTVLSVVTGLALGRLLKDGRLVKASRDCEGGRDGGSDHGHSCVAVPPFGVAGRT